MRSQYGHYTGINTEIADEAHLIHIIEHGN